MHRLRVRYHECDLQGVVFNANYFAYFDIALTEFMRAAFGSYQGLRERGLDVFVVEAGARFRAPARFDEELDIAFVPRRLGGSSMTSSVDIARGASRLCTDAWCTSSSTSTPRPSGRSPGGRARRSRRGPSRSPTRRSEARPNGKARCTVSAPPADKTCEMSSETLQHAQIIVADDDPAAARALTRILESGGYKRVRQLTDPLQIAPTCAQLDPDLLLLDLDMAALDGLQVLERLSPLIQDGGWLQVIVATGADDPVRRRRALALGARDFMSQPLDDAEVLLRVRNALTTRALQRRLAHENERLTSVLAQRSVDLSQARIEVLNHLALAAEYRDDATNEHTRRVGRTAAAVGDALGERAEMVRLLRAAAPLHDIGKIGVPDSVLLKPGRLTAAEFELMKAHTTIGASILAGSNGPELQLAEVIALSHHERWDGNGYPRALAGPAIHLAGRIVAVADVFDALVHPRPYKQAWPIERALQEIVAQRGVQFDPDVVDAFMTLDHDRLALLSDERAAIEL